MWRCNGRLNGPSELATFYLSVNFSWFYFFFRFIRLKYSRFVILQLCGGKFIFTFCDAFKSKLLVGKRNSPMNLSLVVVGLSFVHQKQKSSVRSTILPCTQNEVNILGFFFFSFFLLKCTNAHEIFLSIRFSIDVLLLKTDWKKENTILIWSHMLHMFYLDI